MKSNQPIQRGDYILKPNGQVWCIIGNELIYSSSYDDALDFFNTVSA